jgi:2'-5' RNA ligase
VWSQLSPLRLFVALDLPSNARQALASVAADPGVWRRVRPETLHITLAFLGEQPDAQAIKPLIHTGLPAPHLTLHKVLLLPPRRPRVLTVELQAEGLAKIQHEIANRLEQAGVYTREKRPFRPHVTVARLRPRTRPPNSAHTALEPLDFHGTAVTLYASRLHPSGARYEALETAPFTVP